jgi:hypothetical protein
MPSSAQPRRVTGAPVPTPAEVPSQDGNSFDYGASAELFPTRNRNARRPVMKYRRFARAAEAIRFAIEELPSEALLGAYLEVDEKRFGRDGIQRLYDSERFPLPRRAKRA